jgi:hypothetical protein
MTDRSVIVNVSITGLFHIAVTVRVPQGRHSSAAKQFTATTNKLSSPGLTLRSSKPRPIMLPIAASGILDRPPQCAIAHKTDDDN